MKTHLRTDAVKVFKEDDELLQLVMKNEGLKNKSQAWRQALKSYRDFHKANTELASLKESVEAMREIVQSLYFKVDILSQEKSHD
jgi:hypothetical protein